MSMVALIKKESPSKPNQMNKHIIWPCTNTHMHASENKSRNNFLICWLFNHLLLILFLFLYFMFQVSLVPSHVRVVFTKIDFG